MTSVQHTGIFSRLYTMMLRWAAHRHAPRYLAALSFAESSFFPIPPDVMLMPMALAQPSRAMRFALLTTIASVLGGLLGYLIGYFAIEMVEPVLERAGHAATLQHAQDWFHEYGFWVVLLAGFSPIPYKIFTIAAGGLALALLPFLAASLIGRGSRFFLVAALVAWGGPKIEPWIHRYVDRIGWASVVVLIVLYFLFLH